MPYESDAADAYESEGFESEGFGEFGEANRRRTPRTASGRGLAPAPQSSQSKNFVTYSALRQAMDKVGAQIKTNSDAITGVGNKLNATAAQLKKEFDERKKDSDAIKNDTNQKVSMLALLPLIMSSPTYTIPAAPIAGTFTTTSFTPSSPITLSPPSTSMTNALLPLLLVGGLGGTGTGGSGGMDNTMMLVMALVLANPSR